MASTVQQRFNGKYANHSQKALVEMLKPPKQLTKKETHRGMGIYSGVYYVKPGNLHTFYNTLYKAITDANPAPVHLVEVHKEYGPVLIDLDFKYKPTNGVLERRYTMDMVKGLIKMYIDIMSNCYVLDPHQLQSIVMEKASPSLQEKTGHCKDGVHIMFPNLCITNEMQLLFRKKVLRLLEEDNIFREVHAENKLSDILDEHVIRSAGWMVYGCQKPGGQPYLITKIFDHELQESISPVQYAQEIEEKNEINIIEFLSIRKFNESDLPKLNYGITEEMIEKELYSLGIRNQEREMKDPTQFLLEGSELVPRNLSIDEKVDVENNNIAIARKLVNMLSFRRADDYKEWIHLGLCLHSISETLFDVWDSFSRQSDKYKEGECLRLWNSFNRKELKIGTLYYWAKQDSPAEFKKFKREQYSQYIEIAIFQCTETRMAELIYHLYKDFYVCITSSNDKWIWYEFTGLYWKNLGTMAPPFRLKVEQELHALFEGELRKYQDLAARARADLSVVEQKRVDINNAQDIIDEKMRLDTQMKKYKMYCDNISFLLNKKLGNTSYLPKVINHSGLYFYDENFLNKLDKKLHLICFKNGVYDLENDCFRNGLYEDFISTTAGVDYYPRDANAEHRRYYDTVYNMLRANHPDDADFEYLMMLYASCLQGYREDESFHILKGKGANGKTIETTLLSTAFGDYFANISSALLTQKRASSSSPQADILRLKGKRVVVAEEPDKSEVLNAGIMKELTGGGRLSARTLYSANIETFDCTFVLFLCTNTYPPVHTTDGGTWRRIKVIEYPCKYVLNEAELVANDPYVKMGDPHLKSKVRSQQYGAALMSILIDYYRVFKQKGLYPPPNVRAASEAYQKMSNMYLTFCRDKLLHTNNPAHKLTMVELYSHYKDWFQDATGKKVNANRNEFIECICKELNLQDKTKVIVGYKLKEDDYEEKQEAQ